MAEMRPRTFPYACLLVLLLLALPAVAAADPKPIAKPTNTAPPPAPPPPAAAPAPPPPTPPPPPATPPSPPATPSTGSTHSTNVGTTVIKVITVSGGRDQALVAVTKPHAVRKPVPPPTPLGLVALSDRVSAPSEATPAWKLALLALLAAAEAFLVVRLVRHRPAMLIPA
jgi:hypothetical protein